MFLVAFGYEGLLWHLGESWTTARVAAEATAARNAGRELLYGRQILSDDMQLYKARELAVRKPLVVALGTSTSMQHRGIAFGPYRDRFYNLGGLTQRVDDLPEAAELLADTGTVRLVVLGLDLWWFNESWRPHMRRLDEKLRQGEAALDWRAHQFSIRLVFDRLLRTGPRLMHLALAERSPVAGELAIGLEAREGSGFRASDGSRQYGDHVQRARRALGPPDDAEIVERVERGVRRFEAGTEVSAERVRDLEEFLVANRAAGRVVVGVIGPLSAGTREALARSRAHRGLVDSYRLAMRSTFAGAGMPLVDVYDPSAIGLDDRYMIDGFHGSETLMAHVVALAVLDPRVQRALPRLTPAHLEALLRHPATDPATLAPIGRTRSAPTAWLGDAGGPRSGSAEARSAAEVR